MKMPLLVVLLVAIMLTLCEEVRGSTTDQAVVSQITSFGIVSKLEERSTEGPISQGGNNPFMNFISRKRRAAPVISKKPGPYCTGCFSVIGDPTTTQQ